jgi:hypothetical protein
LIEPPLAKAILSRDRILQCADLALEGRVREHHPREREGVRFDFLRLWKNHHVGVQRGDVLAHGLPVSLALR